MLNSKVVKIFILCICINIFSIGIVFANTDESMKSGNDSGLLEKQREIDQYIFEEHSEEFSQEGIVVTSTRPVEDYIEIGITPYTQENSNYLYEIFGRESIQVVEGEQAVIYQTQTQGNESSSSDSPRTSSGVYILGGGILAIILIVIRKLKISSR